MSDLNWCTYCDSAISPFSDSLYCSEECLRSDALNHHPLLGYDYAELKDFPRSSSPALTACSGSSTSGSPLLSPIPSYTLNQTLNKQAAMSPPAFDLNDTWSPSETLSNFYQVHSKQQSINNNSSSNNLNSSKKDIFFI
ncbi:hypothetical protein K501DRAFT_253903 [Backusella circina FSU 941]|nr:hypothetical protein K501DRAFT_253903 [Backusella circina FSU 941]